MAKQLSGIALLLVCAITASSCVTKAVGGQSSVPSVAPSLVVEQFMRAVNSKDLIAMGGLFGTKDGPVSERDDRAIVEQWMFAIATVMKHDDYTLEGEQIVPGRMQDAKQLNVAMKIGERNVSVPFILVQTKKNTWLIEQVDLKKITGQQ